LDYAVGPKLLALPAGSPDSIPSLPLLVDAASRSSVLVDIPQEFHNCHDPKEEHMDDCVDTEQVSEIIRESVIALYRIFIENWYTASK
jgi:hypothetical protein